MVFAAFKETKYEKERNRNIHEMTAGHMSLFITLFRSTYICYGREDERIRAVHARHLFTRCRLIRLCPPRRSNVKDGFKVRTCYHASPFCCFLPWLCARSSFIPIPTQFANAPGSLSPKEIGSYILGTHLHILIGHIAYCSRHRGTTSFERLILFRGALWGCW